MSDRITSEAATSADGTRIAFTRLGTGPAIVFVHGSLTTGEDWGRVADALSEHFTCYLMDRRGHGGSGDARDYSLSKEGEDIEAVLDVAGPEATLLGHSYGAICALEAAARRAPAKLVLYEPPLPVDDLALGPALREYQAAVEANDLDEALTIGLRDLVRLSPDELAGVQQSPAWSAMAAATPGWLRELDAIERLEPGVARYSKIALPTLLLFGTATAPHHIEATTALARSLPKSRTVEFDGEGHIAHVTATDQVVAAIAEFMDQGQEMFFGRETSR